MPRLSISLLGKMTVQLHSTDKVQSIPGLETGKAGALLAYLAIQGHQAQARTSLAALIWPERTDREALNSLRFSLAKLRTELHEKKAPRPFLLVDKHRVQWHSQADVWVDVLEFERLADACETEAGPTLRSGTIQAALALYRGEFLQDMKFGGSLAYETWALGKRDQLAQQRLRLFKLLSQSLVAEGDMLAAQETYHLILTEQPWDEETHRRLMQLLADAGQRGAALAQYEACRRVLGELGMEPERSTHLLAYQIKNRLVSLPAEPAMPFVARRRELQRLTSFLDRALSSQGQIALIRGEAGSGKTALMVEFARQALSIYPDLLVVGGQCNAFAGIGQAYQPFIETLQMLAGGWENLPWSERLPDEDRNRLYQTLPKIAENLVQVAPALLQHFVERDLISQGLQALTASGCVPGLRPKPDWLRRLTQPQALEKTSATPTTPLEENQFFEQFTRFLSELARQVPLLLLLDDLQWADASSIALLFHLTRRLSTKRILILAAYRFGEVISDEAHPLTKSMTEIQRYGGNILLDLDQADQGSPGAETFVTAWLAQDPFLQPNCLDESFQRVLAKRTAGNPLFTIELLRSLQESGGLIRSATGEWVSRPDLDWDTLPARVDAAIAEQVNRLPPQWRDWLSTASVEGWSFTAEALALVHGITEKEILQALNGPLNTRGGALRLVEGEGLQWLHPPGMPAISLSHYRFRHILFQTYIYQQLDPVDRSRRHAALGAALENLYAGETQAKTQHAAELARHFEAGGMPLKAAAYALLAGQQAVYRAAGEVAVAHYRHGLALLSGLSQSPERNLLEVRLYMGLGAPFLVADDWGGSERREAIEQALQRVRALSTPVDRLEFIVALFLQATWLNSQGESQQVIQLGEEMLTLSENQAGPAWVLAQRTLGAGYMFKGYFSRACQHLGEAFRVYQTIGSQQMPKIAVRNLETIDRAGLGFSLAAAGYPDQGWKLATQSIALARSQSPPILGSVIILASEIAILRGDLPQLQVLSHELINLGNVEALHYFQTYGLGNLGYGRVLAATQVESTDVNESAQVGLEEIMLGWQSWQATGVHTGLGQWLLRLAHAFLQTGQIIDGIELIQQAFANPETKGTGIAMTELYRLQGELFLRLYPAQPIAAETCFQQAIEIAQQQGGRMLELKAAISLARLWQIERAEDARKLLQSVCTGFTEGFETSTWREAQALLDRLS